MRKNKKNHGNTKNKTILASISNPFDCSGSFQLSQPFLINIMGPKQSFVLKFPNPTHNEVKAAADQAKKSGFGKGQENVVDESYRLAFEYLSHELGLPSALMEKIFNETMEAIKHSLGLDCTVRAELIKLNIYPVGGLFKKHVDSPKESAFGSLVVFLPCYFEGGSLIVESKHQTSEFSFGGDPENTKINWVAFYNDCVHEITEVKQGWRLTLSFNLFYESNLQTQLFPSQQLINVLSEGLEQGKVYGYFCDHYYGNKALQKARDQLKNMRFLKGNDYNILVAAKALGAKKILLKVLFKKNTSMKSKYDKFVPESDKEEMQEENNEKQLEKKGRGFFQKEQEEDEDQYDEEEIVLVGNPQNIAKILNYVEQEGERLENQLMFKKQFKTKIWAEDQFSKVVWLNEQSKGSNYTYAMVGYHGNSYEVDQRYCQLVILIYM